MTTRSNSIRLKMPEFDDHVMIKSQEVSVSEDVANEKKDSCARFLRAAKSGILSNVLECLNDDVDIHVSNSNGLNALHLASKEGFPDVVEELIKLGADVNSKTKQGNTPLHIAALAGYFEVTKLLVENGAEVDAQSHDGFTALYMASQEAHLEIARFLLAHGAKQALATQDGYTPLAVALQQGHDQVVSLLLSHDEGPAKVHLPALHIATKKRDTKAVALMLMKEENPDITSKAGFTALHIAAHYGNVDIAKLLIENGANVNFTAKDGITPSHVASKRGRLQMLSLLHANGASMECRTSDSLTPLHCAARSGRGSVIHWLLENGAVINARTKNGLSPLHMAAQGDHVNAAKILLDHGAPIDDVATDLLTPLHVAAHCGSARVAKLLLQRGADLNATASNGFTALHIACKKNKMKIVELLMEYNANLNIATESGLTPLHVAAYEGNASIVQLLIERNAAIDAPTRHLETPLHLATWCNHPDVARILLRAGARVDAIDREYQTALHVACMFGHDDIAGTLLAHGANVEAETYNCLTPLHMAARDGQTSTVRILLRSKASTCAETTESFTPLHFAAKNGHLEISKLLIEGGADANASGINQPTPLLVAAKYDQEDVVDYLLERGAPPQACTESCYSPLHSAAKNNNTNIAKALLQYGADPNGKSTAGVSPLHTAAKYGYADMAALLLNHNCDPNSASTNGLTPLHVCAQEGQVETAVVLLSADAGINSRTKTGYTPLHTACYFGRVNMVRFLLRYGARVDASSADGYTALHEAALKGDREIIDILLNYGAKPNAVTVDGQTALAIGQQLGYWTQLQTLRLATDEKVAASAEAFGESVHYQVPEMMRESESDWEYSGDDSRLSVNYKESAKTKNKGIATPANTLRLEEGFAQLKGQKQMDPADQAQLDKLIETEQHRSASSATVASHQARQRAMTSSPAAMVDQTEPSTVRGSVDLQTEGNYAADNVDIIGGTAPGGKIWKRTFLISFLVDARGGAMRGCRHSGVRIIIPPRKAPMPMRITCRYLRKEKLVHPPPLSEGEALASRILEIGPAGARFLGPVILEIPHFASLRSREREIMIIRSDDGEHWKEHQLEATEDAVQEVLNESFDPEDISSLYDPELTLFPSSASLAELSQLDDLNTTRITRILTNDFPQYFAVVTRFRQEVHAVGPEGGLIASTLIPQVKAIFPDGALTKTIKVSLQAQPIAQELVTKLHGSHVAVSPIVTVEPRRRKFHKPITLCIPLPQSTRKSIFALQAAELTQTNHKEDVEQKEPPTLRLLCSITGGTAPAKWEDITGTTQLTFSTEHVSFTTTVSARFWLMDCPTPSEAATMSQEIYNEAILVPYMAKFVVFARRTFPNEWQLRVFCMTDDKEDKTLERQEHYTEIAKSRDVEVLAARQQYLEFFGNVTPTAKASEQMNLRFVPFQENRLMFTMKKKDAEISDASLNGKICFVKDPRTPGDPPHHLPICTLTITLPTLITSVSLDNGSIGSRSSSLSRKYRFSRRHVLETVHDTDVSIQELASALGSKEWESLARALHIPEQDTRQIRIEYAGQETLIVLKVWLEREGTRASGHNLVPVLRQLGREDVVKKYFESGAKTGASGMQQWDAVNGNV